MKSGDVDILSQKLPARWRVSQRLRNHIYYALIRSAIFGVSVLPWGLARSLMRSLAKVAPWVARYEYQIATSQIAMAMPELSSREHHSIIRKMFLHLGELIAEVLHFKRFVPPTGDLVLDAVSREVLDKAMAQGKGVVAVTGHIGNWELLAQIVTQTGYSVTTVAKPLYDPRLTRLVHRLRTAHGLKLIWRGDGQSSKSILRIFREGGLLALLIDQDTKVPGEFVPFFGRLAYTPTAAASLALRTGAPVIVGWHRRTAAGHAFVLEPCEFVPTGNFDADVVALTALLTARLEEVIRQAPEQWVWLHRRWRRRPEPRAC